MKKKIIKSRESSLETFLQQKREVLNYETYLDRNFSALPIE